MKLLTIIFKYTFYVFLKFLFKLLRFTRASAFTDQGALKESNILKSVFFKNLRLFSFSHLFHFFTKISNSSLFNLLFSTDTQKNFKMDSKFVKSRENLYLLRILCFFLRINLNKDSEALVSKIFNLNTENIISQKNGQQDLKLISTISSTIEVPESKILENQSVSYTVNQVFPGSSSYLSSNLNINSQQPIENAFLHNHRTSFDFLTKDSGSSINFDALQNLHKYFKTFSNPRKTLAKLNDKSYRQNLSKFSKKSRVPKNFKGGILKKKISDNSVVEKSQIEALKRELNILKQIEFLLKNRKLLEAQKLNWKDLNLAEDVKRVMFSTSNKTGPYGSDSVVYTSDLYSKNRMVVSRRINLLQNESSLKNLNDLKSKLGFANFNFTTSEEFENSSDVPLGGWFTGQFYFVNPFVVLGFIFYSILELSILIYIMSFFFGNPYETLIFFFKYPLVYFYDNLSFFPSANHFFSALMFWLVIIFTFQLHLIELIDEERFDPPHLSWASHLVKDFMYTFLVGWCGMFCIFELITFCDLLISRVFFIGVPGYPNIISILFLLFYDVFYLLGCTGYFSFYLESFLYLDIKFPSFYFSDYAPLVQRYPLVQPYFFGNPYLDRPNFFLWVCDSLLNFFSGETKKSFFLKNDEQLVFQREIIQDIRKYNYIRKNLIELKFLGQLYARGWNGFNYRLDLQTFIDPIIPAEQVIRFDWRLKNTHFNGMYSRLFSSINFGSDSNQNTLVKKIRMFRGRRLSSRYGYFSYLKNVNKLVRSPAGRAQSDSQWFATQPQTRLYSTLRNLPQGARKTLLNPRKTSSYFFSPTRYRFANLIRENKRISTKADRNFRYSRLLKNFWSSLPGNDMPRDYFRYKPFISITNFLNLPIDDYNTRRSFLKRDNLVNQKNLPIEKYSLRNLYLNKPQVLFPTTSIDERELALKTSNSSNNLKNSKKNFNINHRSLLNNKIKSRSSRNFSPFSLNETNFISDQKLKSSKNNDLSLFSSDYPTKNKRIPLQKKDSLFYKHSKKKRLNISAIPNFPFRILKKHKFASKIFQNFQPKYFLRPTASLTTFSKVEDSSTSRFLNFFNFSYKIPLNLNSGLNYTLSVFFLGFGRLLSASVPIKFISFDYYYSQNHNFFYSLFDNYLKQNQFRVMLTSKARFNHPLKGGFRHNIDFLYPMLSELRLKEKLLPVDFLYNSHLSKNYGHLRLDPYESIRASVFYKGPCYFLDARIQNWLNFNNVIWNEYFHFFFNRSFKTEGNGSKFFLASYNPIQGPSSYKLFIDSPTLETPRVGQYFYNYISWLQYKFKWLLHPTSTYKRFDSFRFVHQHANKKFYFTSLLKFYQMNLFRWQQAAQIFQWNQLQSRNFLLHLFFHKYQLLFEIQNLKTLFDLRSLNNKIINYSDKNLICSFKSPKNLYSLTSFNDKFFHENENSNSSKSEISKLPLNSFLNTNTQFFIPAFTSQDFRFFQYVTDLRRWKALQTSYIRDWKFEKYVQYLGPLLYKDDVASLMGFFAPFEYRNQIVVSKLRNDSLRFSVFFPKKIIDEKFANPTKKLSFPPQQFHSRGYSKSGSLIATSKPMYYAYVINKPFLSSGSNYSFFSKKGKKFFSGLYPNLERFKLSGNFNLISDSNFFDINSSFNSSFYELNTKKKRFLKDKDFWLSKNYELQQIRDRITNSFNHQSSDEKIQKLRIILDQLGKPLDSTISTSLPKLQFFGHNNKYNLGDSNFIKSNPELFQQQNSSTFSERFRPPKILPYIYPDIFMRFGGPKASSRRWHLGQSWMKFVIASQNVSVFPEGRRRFQKYYKNNQKLRSAFDALVQPASFFNGFDGKPKQYKFSKLPEIKRRYGFFNFGLSGIGRLPRLSRSFFHMLFFRNKLDDFKNLKIQFLKLYLMSIPLFHNTDFSSNASFKIFWSFITGLNYSKYALFNFRYNLLFTNFNAFKTNINFSSLLHHSNFGTLFSSYDHSDLLHGRTLILHNQYSIFKSLQRFRFFSNIAVSHLDSSLFPLNFTSLLPFSSVSLNFQNSSTFYFFKYTFDYVKKIFVNFFISFSFNFFNYFFINYELLHSKNDPNLIFFNFDDKSLSNFLNFKNNYSIQNFLKFKKSVDYSSFYVSGFNSFIFSDYDSFRSRLYYGSFRSNLHWYFYPVHYCSLFQYFVSENILNFFSGLFNYTIYLSSKFGNMPYFKFGTHQIIDLNFKHTSFLYSSIYSNFSNFYFNSNSDFFKSFNLIYSNLAKFNSNNFLILITNRVTNFDFLKNLFLYENADSRKFKYFLIFNTFFFNNSFFFFANKISNHFNFIPETGSAFVSDFEILLNNLFEQSVSLDGSGRHNRPKSVSQTLNKVFTYREYEKYRHEHHRQRFRGITPHWVQNTVKNRSSYQYFYRSAEYRKRKKTKFLLNKMFRYVRLSRSRFSPQRLNRISYRDPLNNIDFLSALLSKDLSNKKNLESTNKSSVNFFDTSRNNASVYYKKTHFFHNKFFRSQPLEKYSDLIGERSKILKDFFERNPKHPSLKKNYSRNRFFKYRHFLLKHSPFKFSLKKFKRSTQFFKVNDGRAFSFWLPPKMHNLSDFNQLFFQKFDTLANKRDLFFPGFDNLKDSTNLKFVSPTGFYRDGGNFINTKNFFSLNNLFTSPTSYYTPVNNKKFFVNSEGVSDSKDFTFDTKIDLKPTKSSLRKSIIEPFHRTSPLYLRTLRSRRALKNVLTANNLGGSSSTSRYNSIMKPKLPFDLESKRRRRRVLKHSKKYPSNVKRFVRPFSKVIMSIPYLYSKWFTQNPRLSTSVNNDSFRIFSNNSYDEFNYICVQSLLLLKRKMMYNVIGIKLVSYKHKILYFSNLGGLESSNFVTKNVFIFFSDLFDKFVKILKSFFSYFDSGLFFLNLYQIRSKFLILFFQNDFFFVRLLYNPLIKRYTHDSEISSDMLFFEDFYYKQTAKRILSQIAFSSHSVGGWNNPLGLSGQYIPGLNFYSKGSVNFNFNYQYPDFYSGRFFSPEILLDNNLIRQNVNLYDRNYLFHEFSINSNYRKSWHFLSPRVNSPVSPFIEYEKPHYLIFQRKVKNKNYRLPLMSLRRVRDVYPNYLKSFFSTLVVDNTNYAGHDITLPFKLKLLNFSLKSDPHYKRELLTYFKSNISSFNDLNTFATAFKYKQLKIMADFHDRMNLSSLVNKRRFGLRKRVWSPFRYNFYYKFNWRTFIHKFSETDLTGFRNYKLNSYFDLYNGTIVRSLKLRALQHLIVSQIPRNELDARRRVPLNFSAKEFSLNFYQYFNYVNNNFLDKGYSNLNKKILKYASRKGSFYQPTHFFRRASGSIFNFYSFIDPINDLKKNFSDFLFRKPKVSDTVLRNYTNYNNPSNKAKTKFKHHFFRLKNRRNNFNFYYPKSKRNPTIFKKLLNLIFSKNKYIFDYFIGKTFSDLSNYNLRLRFLIQRKFQKPLYMKSFYKKAKISFVFLNPSSFPIELIKRLRSASLKSQGQGLGLMRKILTGFFSPVIAPGYLTSTNVSSLWFIQLQNNFMCSGFNTDKLISFSDKTYAYKKFHGFPKYYRQTILQNFFDMTKKFFYPYRTISRIYGINTLFNLKKSRERFLNPQAWLSFDLFSRIRPSFRPFLYKFSKQFMFSKFIPAKGISSYNTFIRSHTLYDSFFERHPYISFSIGLNSNNQLIASETMYKEIRRRSNILDFSRRHFKFFNPLNFYNQKGAQLQKKDDFDVLKNLRNNLYLNGKFRTKRQVFFNNKLFTNNKNFSPFVSLFFNRKMNQRFISGKVRNIGLSVLADKKAVRLNTVSRLQKKFFSVMPLHYRFNGILRNANYYSNMTRPIRRLRFLNTFLIKPYNSLLKFIRYDNYVISNTKFFSTFILNYGSLNPMNNSRMRSYYQPNLKLFFDFNAYKQRYNLGLLFRGLSFENDFQFFLFRKTKFFNSGESYNMSSMSSFLRLSLFQYFNLLVSKDGSQKGFVINSKLEYLIYFFEKFIFKFNPIYLLLIFVDFYLGFFYSLFYIFSQLYFFDFSFFLNFFSFSDVSFYYLKKRPIFQIFFHLAHLNEYLKFSWLFSIKFLIFNFEYYPYYFLAFSFLLILRVVSFNINKKNFASPFIVPYNSRFSDFRLNVHSGWFDTAWKEVKLEAFDRLYALHTSNSFNLSHNSSISFDDIKRIKRRYQLQNQKTNFFEPEDIDPKNQVDLSKYENLSRNDEKFQRPLSRITLKRFLSRMWFPTFLLPSFDSSNSSKLESLDFDVKSKFLGNSKVVLPSKNKAFDSNFLKDLDSSNIRDRSRLSFFFIKKQMFLFFSGKISFFKFVDNLNIGLGKVTLNKSNDYPEVLNNYKIEDFSEEFSRLFIDPNSEFNNFSNKHLAKKRMFPDDENIHFYRKPGSILQSELLARKRGTETDQLYYVVEFPGRFNNTYINAFSKAYAIRNLNFNAPYYGFFTFPKNAKLPNTFEEFVLFCSDENNRSLNMSQDPKDKFVAPDIEKMKELWSIFQYVVRYEYNMFNEFDFQDNHLFDVLSKVQKGDRYTLFDNLKFWFNKASVDAIDLNFWNRNFYLNMPFVSNQELDMYGSKQNEDQDMTETFNGSDISDVLGTPTQSYSLLYIFYVYLIFFVFFFFLSFFFCCLFLFFVSLYNYALFFF